MVRFVVIFSLIAAGLGAGGRAIWADEDSNIDGLKREIDAKNEEVKGLEAEAEKIKSSLEAAAGVERTLAAELKRIERNIGKMTNDIRLTSTKISRTELEIKKFEAEIKEKGNSIQRQRSRLGILVATLAESERQGILDILLRHNALSEFFSAIEQLLGIQLGIHDELAALRTLRQELGTKKSSSEVKKQELVELRNDLNSKKIIEEQERKERANLLTLTKNQEKRYQELLNETESKRLEIISEIEALEEKLRLSVDPSSLPENRSGVLAWPVLGKITQGYGLTAFVRLADFYRFHNGIDIRGVIGTPVRAAESGEVVAVGDTDRFCRNAAYGKHIVIRHPNNLTTLYAHLSLIRAETRQKIERNQVIGYMGSTGLSTGPHLHFTVYDSNTLQIRQSRFCGVMPYGGSINPLNYL